MVLIILSNTNHTNKVTIIILIIPIILIILQTKTLILEILLIPRKLKIIEIKISNEGSR